MSYGGHPYGGVAYAASDVAGIPQDQTEPILAVEVAFTTGALEEPAWVDIAGDVRSWDSQRGRNRELERFQPGRATVVLGNASRQYDSVNTAGPWYGNLKPMRRVRIRETFNGVTFPVFDGFVDRWQLDYPLTGKDATATMVATDAFKILVRTDLPVSVYDHTVQADTPGVYWRLDQTKNAAGDATIAALNSGILGPAVNGTYVGPPVFGGEALVVADPGPSMVGTNSNQIAGTQDMGVVLPNAAFDLLASSFVVELWCIPEYQLGSNVWLWEADSPGGSSSAALRRGGTTFTFGRTNSAATTINLNSAGTEVNNTRYHIVCRHVFGEPLRMWINGTLFTGSTSTGTFDADAPLRVGHPAVPAAPGGSNWQGPISHFAVYTGAAAAVVDQTWVDRHYTAGTAPWQDDQPGTRLGRVLDLAEWPSTLREVDTGNVALQSAEFGAQSVLEHSQKVAETESGALFMARAGTVRHIDRAALAARVSQPAPFGDTAGEVGFRILVPDDGDQTIRNRAVISRYNGVAQTAEDPASVSEFGRFDYRLEGLLHRLDSYSQTYADLIVAEYKDPRRRITSLALGPTTDAATIEQMLGRELGDVITVRHRPPGGGPVFQQACVVEGITAAATPKMRTATFTLSPAPAGIDPIELAQLLAEDGDVLLTEDDEEIEVE